jgi:hypothetical protein
MSYNGKVIPMLRHIFVFECFGGEVDSSQFHIDHIDANPRNNSISNLQKLSKGDHMRKTILTRKSSGPATSRPIRRYKLSADGIRYDEKDYASVSEASMDVCGRRSGSLADAAKDASKTRHGYHWEYITTLDLEGEIWCSLRDRKFRGIEVSSKGRIKTRIGAKTFGHKGSHGYCKINIAGSHYAVHRLVCLAFHGAPPSGAHTSVDHIDRRKDNNVAGNLRWATPKMQVDNAGSMPVIAYTKNGVIAKQWESHKQAARELGVTSTTIRDWVSKKCLQRGYLWGLADSTHDMHVSHSDLIVADVLNLLVEQCVQRVEHPDLDGEIWCSLTHAPYRPIQVSNKGRVQTTTGVKTFGYKNKHGHYTFRHKGKTYYVHHLICVAFKSHLRPSSKHIVDHIDRDKTNNHIDNLRWVSMQAQNALRKAKPIIALYKDGRTYKRWDSLSDAARELNGFVGAIAKCANDKIPSYKGYKWAYG